MNLVKNVRVTRLSAGLVSAALALATGGCGPVPAGQGSDQVRPELTFDQLTFRVYRGSALTAQGHAGRAAFRRDSSDLAAERVEVLFPETPGHPAARVTAARGEGNLREHRFSAAGGLRAEQAGQVAVTEAARYAGADGIVRGDRPIEVTGGRFVVRGPAFTLDPRDQTLRIEGGATAVAGEQAR